MLRVLNAAKWPLHFTSHCLSHSYASILLAVVDPPAIAQPVKQTPSELPLNPEAYAALKSDIAHVDGRNLQTIERERVWNLLAMNLCHGEGVGFPLQ